MIYKLIERRGIKGMEKFGWNKRGQIGIYVIIALLVVGVILGYFIVSTYVLPEGVSAEFQPIYTQYESCIKEKAELAISLAESQGGWVEVPDYVPGSEFAPSSSQLNFLGFPVPYWYYISNNGQQKEQVPTKSEIEEQISTYVAERINECDFEKYYGEGFFINLSDRAEVKTTINDNSIQISVNAPLVVYKEKGGSARRASHNVEITSNLGALYKDAISIYNKEKSEAFLENYGVDIFRTYAPVDGVELGCSGKVWKTREVINNLKQAIAANMGAIKFASSKEKDYFVVEAPVKNNVNLMYSPNWPTKIEIIGANDELMVAEPVGIQEGMGAMGFCYAPYHFVYNIYYPVLIQISSGMEIFQFPVVVVIDRNMPREGIYSEIMVEEATPDVCAYLTQDVDISVYDTKLNRLDANISYSCLNQICNLGETIDGRLVAKAPACVNGILIAKRDGYADKKQVFSTNEETSTEVIMDKEYNVELELESGGKRVDDRAIVSFVGEGGRTISSVLPELRNIKISEGFYNISIYVYKNSTLVLPSTTKRQCTEVPKGAFGGFFGMTEEKCYDIEIPETKIEGALIGGGKGEIYLLESDLEKGKLKLEIGMLPEPKSLNDLQNNFQLFEALSVGVGY